MPRPFVFNLTSGDRVRTVQISVQLLVRGASNERIALNNIPLIENALLTAFSAAEYHDLLTQAGRQELNLEALRAARTALANVSSGKIVEQVLFTGFVVQ